MKEKSFKIVCITLLVIFAAIIVGLVSYIYELQADLSEKNNVAEIVEITVDEDEKTEKTENTIEDNKIVDNKEKEIAKVSGKIGEFFEVKENSEYGIEINKSADGKYAGWESEFLDGCGWWCTVEGMNEEVRASSTLRNDKHINYLANNVVDNIRSNSWVEGVEGDGIGEWIELSRQYLCYEGDTDGGKLGEICIVTGYANNEKLWKENNRVKTLLMYINNEPYKYIELEDTIKPQFFTVWDNETYELEPSEKIKLKFEIVEIYEGTKYDDTAITYLDVDFLKGH